jgi:hypothetical protein
VSGEVVPVEDEGERERPERLGEKAVRRRLREPVRIGVKGDWKRLVRVGVTIFAVGMVLECWCLEGSWIRSLTVGACRLVVLTIVVLQTIAFSGVLVVETGNVGSSCPATRGGFG